MCFIATIDIIIEALCPLYGQLIYAVFSTLFKALFGVTLLSRIFFLTTFQVFICFPLPFYLELKIDYIVLE